MKWDERIALWERLSGHDKYDLYINLKSNMQNELKERISEEDKKELVYGDCVSKIIDYLENNKRIDEEIVEKQIKEANETLLNWAKSLPDDR